MADTPASSGSNTSPATVNKTQAATYARLFPEQLLDRCSPDALESNSGPVAYLHALYQQAIKLEASSRSADRRTLSQRRPDIPELLLSEDALERPISALSVVINALTHQVQEAVGKDRNLAEQISQTGVRAALPFHRPLHTIEAVLRRKNLPLFDAMQRSSYAWPNLSQGSLRSEDLREAMRASAGFSPALQELLLDDAEADDTYLIKHFGVTGNTPLTSLLQVDVFCQQTGLSADELLELLATTGIRSKQTKEETAVRCSLAYPSGITPAPTGYDFGAVFIHNGKGPALSLEDKRKDGITTRMIKGAKAGHFARINKLIRLRKALDLSFADTDLLLMSALRAEGQTKDFKITPHTLQALGVFRYFKEVYGVTAEQFSALIYQISPYALDGAIPFLDRVLDGPGTDELAGVAAGLSIDDRAFDLDAASLTAGRSKADPLVSQLSKALGVDERTVRLLVTQVTQSRGLRKPVLSLDLLSSLYRLSRLPRLFGLSRAQGACLMALVTVDKATAQSTLAGKGVIGDVANTPDILDVLVALANTEQWLRRQKLSASSVLAVLSPTVQTPELLAAMEAQRQQLLAGHLSDLRGDCVSEQSIENLLRGNETLKPKQGTWLALLATYIDEQGLIKVDLPDEDRLSDALQPLFKDQLTGDAPALPEMANRLASLLTNAFVAQEDLVKNIIVHTLGRGLDDKNLLSEYALPLLSWIGKKPIDVLKILMRPDAEADVLAQQQADAFTLWSNLARHAAAIRLTGLTPAGLQALVANPQWFNFNDTVAVQNNTASSAATLTLDLLYRLTRYREWVAICRSNGFEESHALLYLQTVRSGGDTAAIEGATRQLAALLGWEASEVLLAVPYVTMLKPVSTPAATAAAGAEVATWDTFRSTLNAAEAKMFDFSDSMQIILHDLHCTLYRGMDNQVTVRGDVQLKLVEFLKKHPGPLNVTQAQFDAANAPEEWAKRLKSAGNGALIPEPLKLQVYDGKTIVSRYEETEAPCVPDTLGDIDLVMRLQALCKQTGLSCQSLLNLTSLDDTSDFALFSNVADELLGACDEETRDQIEREIQEQWRDALVESLIQAWTAEGGIAQNAGATPDDVCDHLLTDIGVSWKAKPTTQVSQAVASLQHYLYRLFARLEPGYDDRAPDDEDKQTWQRYLSDYSTWKQWRTQINHPENLIYYANRPKKSKAFQELELEINQGKVDSELLHNAVCGYLTKFEALSNLQVVSGYLDGRNPKLDTYYLIGKNNTSPAQYYWRSVDMGLRDDKERLSPLAWSEWARIDIPISGNVAQSIYTDPKNSAVTIRADAIRMVIIAGRPYVIWVERGVNGLPSSDERNQTPTKFKKLSVQYSFLQTDGFWSPANALLVLDGCKDGVRLKDEGNPYLKDDTYVPGLIALVNVEGERVRDPWLTIVMYDCVKQEKGKENEDYFIEMRDLLLLERKTVSDIPPTLKTGETQARSSQREHLIATLWATYQDIQRVQHTFYGYATRINGKHSSWQHALKDTTDSSFMPLMVQSREKTNLLTLSMGENTTDTFSGNVIVKIIPPSSQNTKNEETIADQVFKAGQDKKVFETTYNAEQEGQYSIKVEILDEKRKPQHSRLYQFSLSNSLVDELWSVSIVKNESQAQLLDLSGASEEPPLSISHKVRLNTLFGKQLVARATQSVERALGWGTQKLVEPEIDKGLLEPPVDLHGANGLYFRELFLHLPALVATRLTEQQQFEEAENWYLQYLFDPYRAHKGAAGQAPYWNTRPLAEVGKLTSLLIKSTDPTERAFVLSRYYQQAVFLGLVENWQRQGDHLYRQLTLSSLNQAWRCYQQALRLIGPLAEGASVSSWTPTPLSGLTDATTFSQPFNPRVTEARRTLQQRLFNLRHGLTLDGKLLPNLDWRHEGSDPFGAAKGGLSIIANSYNSDRATIPAYRFRQLIPIARAAAQQLLDMGRHYMKLMEDEANTALDALLKSQEIKISDFTLRLKKEAISAANARRKTLEISRKSAAYRHRHFEDLLQTSLSEKEMNAALTGTAGVNMGYVAQPFIFAEGVANVVPNIVGLAVGGSEWGAPPAAIKEMMQWDATVDWSKADLILVQAEYERRAQEWELEKRLAELDIELIEQEIAEQDIEINAAGISLEESRQERLNLEEAYIALTTGFSIVPTYNWLVARQELLYGKAYDAVLSLCLSVEAAWRYEIGDYTREAFINTSAWSDSYKGMLTGESLLIDLQQMENAYLLENERRLTMSKTFSLRTLIGQSTAAANQTPQEAWNNAMKGLIAGKPLMFAFKEADFNSSYPGQYLRQLKYVTVSFALSTGSNAREISALLTQTGNTTLIAPDKAGVDYLYAKSTTVPASIKRNLRAQQQIALSSTLKEDGLGYGHSERVFELMFHDERYLPFEGTGAISQWELTIPGAECRTRLASRDEDGSIIEDIDVTLVYTAVGDSALIDLVQSAVPDAPSSSGSMAGSDTASPGTTATNAPANAPASQASASDERQQSAGVVDVVGGVVGAIIPRF